MQEFIKLTDRGRDALMKADWKLLHDVMNANFDLRRSIMPIVPENLRMVEVARQSGASAKFAGSGGAICGLYHSARQYQDLVDALAEIRCTVLRPMIFDS
jgi:glucuronokinase